MGGNIVFKFIKILINNVLDIKNDDSNIRYRSAW